MTRAQLKAMSKEQIRGNIGSLFLISLIATLIGSGLSCIPMVGSVASAVISPALSLGITAIYLGITEGRKPAVGDMFSMMSYWGKAFLLNLLITIFVALWSLLLYIPGIVKGLSYSFAPYILADNPELTAREALNQSKEMTNGHKSELFILGLSFIGWILLGIITFGIALIWVMPYMNTTYANFYRSIKNGAAVIE